MRGTSDMDPDDIPILDRSPVSEVGFRPSDGVDFPYYGWDLRAGSPFSPPAPCPTPEPGVYFEHARMSTPTQPPDVMSDHQLRVLERRLQSQRCSLASNGTAPSMTIDGHDTPSDGYPSSTDDFTAHMQYFKSALDPTGTEHIPDALIAGGPGPEYIEMTEKRGMEEEAVPHPEHPRQARREVRSLPRILTLSEFLDNAPAPAPVAAVADAPALSHDAYAARRPVGIVGDLVPSPLAPRPSYDPQRLWYRDVGTQAAADVPSAASTTKFHFFPPVHAAQAAPPAPRPSLSPLPSHECSVFDDDDDDDDDDTHNGRGSLRHLLRPRFRSSKSSKSSKSVTPSKSSTGRHSQRTSTARSSFCCGLFRSGSTKA
ncbi:MAG: hypothetical protein M1838_004491 [Thelocarpon superellum]|nr:MAG: hypothetical protein M1838_004491 [Thelocarpon superellum]